jgi:uncharacterized protein YecE (DUF72 family)
MMIRVGMSGWTFAEWRKDFYPEGLPQKKELEYASREMNSLEINGTFYALQKPATFKNWGAQVPKDFVMALKAPQFITHVLRLKDCEDPLYNFLASGPLCLGEKMGPLLWQFPSFMTLKDDRFADFIKLLPHTAKEMSAAAKKHGPKVKGRAFTKASGDYRVRHAFEFRHPSFNNKDFLAMLKEHNIAAVIHHASKESAEIEEVTADFAYVRLFGEGKKYAKGYPAKEIKEWAKTITQWSKEKKDVFAYFGTEAKAYAPFDAIKLSKELGLGKAAKKAA